MKTPLLVLAALASFSSFAGPKIVYNSISACVQDLYDNTPHTKESAKATCLQQTNVQIHYASISACVQDLYDNTPHTRESAKAACLGR